MKYAEKGKGWLGFPRKLARSAGDNPDSIYPWLNFIPNGTYTTMLQQGLLLIFGVRTRSLADRKVQTNKSIGSDPSQREKTTYFGNFWQSTFLSPECRVFVRRLLQ